MFETPSPGFVPNTPTRIWRGMRDDAELQNSWLERLNAIPEVEVCSTCCGHPDGVGMGLGGLKSPTFSFKLRNRNEAEGKAIVRVFRLNPLLMSFANVRVWSDAELDAKDLNELFSECQLTFKSGSAVMEDVVRRNGRTLRRQVPGAPISQIMICIICKIENVPVNAERIARWWDGNIAVLEQFKFKRSKV